jgi:hypothetical protein
MIKKIILSFLLIINIAFNLKANDSTKIVLKSIQPEPYQGELFRLVGQVVANAHYRKLVIDDKLSAELLNNYIKHLDPLHLYFLESDITNFDKYKFIYFFCRSIT